MLPFGYCRSPSASTQVGLSDAAYDAVVACRQVVVVGFEPGGQAMSPTATRVGGGVAAVLRPTSTARVEVRLASSRICFWLVTWAAGGPEGAVTTASRSTSRKPGVSSLYRCRR